MIYAAYCASPKCGKRIVYVAMMTGRSVACDPSEVIVEEQPHYIGRTLITRDGRTIKHAGRRDTGYVPHSATCKNGTGGGSARRSTWPSPDEEGPLAGPSFRKGRHD